MHPLKHNAGAIAQLVEQRTENPCVPGSIPGGTTERKRVTKVTLFLFASFCMILNGFVGSTGTPIQHLPHTFQQQLLIKKSNRKNYGSQIVSLTDFSIDLRLNYV